MQHAVFDQGYEFPCLRLVELLVSDMRLQRAEERSVICGGSFFQPVEEGSSEFSGRSVYDPYERDVVVLVGYESHVAEGVLDFLSLEETYASPDHVFEMLVQQGLFEGP